MPEYEARPLHLYTLEILLTDLVSGRSIITSNGVPFAFESDETRSALEWYRKKGQKVWLANINVPSTEELVDTIQQKPIELANLPFTSDSSSRRRLRLKRVEAHRFAGLHKFGTPSAPPQRFLFEFKTDLTLFEGRNGSGKTSLLNAIVWALTGELLRPQREPETAADFECSFASDSAEGEATTHKISAVTPLPHAMNHRPGSTVLADTWVELTFEDEEGRLLPPIRRSQSRSRLGKLQETAPDFTALRVDPIALRLGTVMPGLLSLIRVGSESELGRAVAQLTGLSALVDLADHVRRSRNKIKTDLVKLKVNEINQIDSEYRTAMSDFAAAVACIPEHTPPQGVPEPSDENAAAALLEIAAYFEAEKLSIFQSARLILGQRFDPSNPQSLGDLEKNVGRAVERASRPQDLECAKRLGALRRVTEVELEASEERLRELLAEGVTLFELASDPSLAARTRLYARIAAWLVEHPEHTNGDSACVVCGLEISEAVDQVSGRLVTKHLQEAHANAELFSLTLKRWAVAAQGELMRTLPEPLRSETTRSLPSHPCDLLRAALIEELFNYEPLLGVLANLKEQTAIAFDEAVKNRAPLYDAPNLTLPEGCELLEDTLKRLDLAMRFARWRHSNDALVMKVLAEVLGKVLGDDSPGKQSLVSKLLKLDSLVKATKPISDVLVQCERLKRCVARRRAAELRLSAYAIADRALGQVAEIGRLADEQVEGLRRTLSGRASGWRSRIYLGAFPGTAQELVDTPMGRNGELGLSVRVGGVSAPAEHVSNASALRASLVGFFFAFWEHVLKQRGGITTLLLDDPQELLDDENRDRFASALAEVVAAGAQLVVTSYDARFCLRITRLVIPAGISHFGVYPATEIQSTIRLCEPLPELEKRRKLFDADHNDEECARNYADACRVFLEAKLGDLFDDPAHAAWATANRDPTLVTFVQRLRPLVRAGSEGMFNQHVFQRFATHAALSEGSPVTLLMNKAHHGRRHEIRAADVAICADELSDLLEIVEEMYEECLRWKRRDRPKDENPNLVLAPLTLIASADAGTNIPIWPSLAASVRHDSGGSQEPLELLDPGVLQNKSAFVLRRPNFGFAAPIGSIALVEAIDGPAADRRLVIARVANAIYARRLIRGATSPILGLTAEVPDPRTRTPKTVMIHQNAVALHQVVGIIFDHSLKVQPGSDEAVQVDVDDVLKRVEIAFRIVDESAVPLALAKQVVLGGENIELSNLAQYEGKLVAVALDDGSGIFKRLGPALPGSLNHLRQFESIGGLGASQLLAVGKTASGFRSVVQARAILGVLYHG
ncbi:AAA domain-containing protein [Granulicella rosea]|uniref:AAA domain-containing protein n=1 Tax=Granulicella rosea TaxID=474952 RepID=A0A239E7P9_9BACT|nr:ATP-binding protein [Granulicella rosea]SNS40780.1 AAA domain-containing protein [Granulicella rosea]